MKKKMNNDIGEAKRDFVFNQSYCFLFIFFHLFLLYLKIGLDCPLFEALSA